jgi:hypothetical protein
MRVAHDRSGGGHSMVVVTLSETNARIAASSIQARAKLRLFDLWNRKAARSLAFGSGEVSPVCCVGHWTGDGC